MKTCFRCEREKPLTEFHKTKRMKDGHLNKCKECARADAVRWNRENKERKAQQGKAWYEKNRERLGYSPMSKLPKEEARRRRLASALKYAHKRRDQKGNTSVFSKYDPEFCDLFWSEVFAQTKLLEYYTNKEYHVDHIIPLNGKSVSGFHIPENIQILTSTENLRKGNNF